MRNSLRGIVVLICTIAIQLTLGLAYIWTAFQSGVAEFLFNNNQQLASLPFSLLLVSLTVASIFGGKIARRFSTRVVVIAGGIIVGIGFIASGFVTSNAAWLLPITYGVIGGAGMGFTYTTTIACSQKWFPHKKGFITGLVVAALGLGTVAFVPLVNLMIERFQHINVGQAGFGGSFTFIILGIIFLVVCTVGGIFMKNPPEGYTPQVSKKEIAASDATAYTSGEQMPPQATLAVQGEDAERAPPIYTVVPTIVKPKKKRASEFPQRTVFAKEMLKSGYFYLTVFSFFFAVVGGLMVINFAQQIADGRGFSNVAVVAILAVGLSNTAGRLLWGFISDKLGRINTLFILLGGTALISPFVMLVPGFGVFFFLAIIGLLYGGILSIYPALTAELFGAKNMATNYGFVLLGFGVGAVAAGQIGGAFRNLAIAQNNINLMSIAFYITAACAFLSAMLLLVLKLVNRRKKKKLKSLLP